MFDCDRWRYHYFEKSTRYYLATLPQDLFGMWVLKREWGNIERRSVQSLVMAVASYDEAVALLAATITRRVQRHYIEIVVDEPDGADDTFAVPTKL